MLTVLQLLLSLPFARHPPCHSMHPSRVQHIPLELVKHHDRGRSGFFQYVL